MLFLWATCATLPEAMALMGAWGFTYKTVAFTWVKLGRRPLNSKRYLAAKTAGKPIVFYAEPPDRNARPYLPHNGMGHYSRQSSELCLLGTRGRVERLDRGVPQLITAPVREHSRKPAEAYERIERLYGDVPRLELFARSTRNGWHSWGDEVEKFDNVRRTAP